MASYGEAADGLPACRRGLVDPMRQDVVNRNMERTHETVMISRKLNPLSCRGQLPHADNDSLYRSDIGGIDFAILIGISTGGRALQADDDPLNGGDVSSIDYTIAIGITRSRGCLDAERLGV